VSKEAEFSLEFGEEGAEEGITLIHFKSNYLEIVVSLAINHYQLAGEIGVSKGLRFVNQVDIL
jgi:hypothetical protein